MNIKDFLNRIISAFYKYVVPLLKTVSNKIDLYYVSLGIFALAAITGAISLLLRLSLKKARNSSCFNLLTFFAICFVFDLFVCVCEHEFKEIYFKSLFQAFSFCFIKLLIGSVFFAIIAAETVILRRKDKKNEQQQQKTQPTATTSRTYGENNIFGNPYSAKNNAATLSPAQNKSGEQNQRAAIIETPFCPFRNNRFGERSENDRALNADLPIEQPPRSVEFLQRASQNKNDKSNQPRPDVNVAYVRALCECLKKETVFLSDREKVADIELLLKSNDFNTAAKVRALNEDLGWLIKRLADLGAKIC